MAHGRTVCYWCDGSIWGHQPVPFEGKAFCCSTCIHKFQQWMQKEQLAFQLQPAIHDKEGDVCACHRCRDP